MEITLNKNPRETKAIVNIIENYYDHAKEIYLREEPNFEDFTKAMRAHQLFSMAIALYEALDEDERKEYQDLYDNMHRSINRIEKSVGFLRLRNNPDDIEANPKIMKINPMTVEEAMRNPDEDDDDMEVNPPLLIINPLSRDEAIKINPVEPYGFLIDTPKKHAGVWYSDIYNAMGYVDRAVGITRKESINRARAKIKKLM